ncbi:MAG: alpha/beta hydrolase [Salibaculum sp.]|uniref:alpha/beta fold hydrolase n=1 Tax=Salibaculum sp. TaxID=2855480 RepID=UPI002870A010|nr:alpha/beta hydrolase [Salibaculum sp.]MDR9427389.1 alpha/beta hydrolase [Salibaculum sp.]MDR9482469.1 alpha/beta hydrolase [Salibaculum sp.]
MKFLVFLLVLLVLAAAVHLRAGARESRWEARFPPLGQVIEVEGTRVHALVKGDGPDLVLIHGSSGNLRDFSFALVDRLAEDYRVIAFDRPGLGYTERLHARGATIAEQAALLQKAAAQLGAERPLVLGQSYGGAVALSWAVTQPQALAGLALVSSPTHPWDGHVPALYRINGSRLGAALAVPPITALVPQSYIRDQVRAVFDPEPMPEGYDSYVGAELAARRVSLRANARQRLGLLDQITRMQPRYDSLDLPIELIHGTADTTVGLSIHAEKFIREVPQANLTRLEGVGHLPHHTAPEATRAAIDRAATRAGLR